MMTKQELQAEFEKFVFRNFPTRAQLTNFLYKDEKRDYLNETTAMMFKSFIAGKISMIEHTHPME